MVFEGKAEARVFPTSQLQLFPNFYQCTGGTEKQKATRTFFFHGCIYNDSRVELEDLRKQFEEDKRKLADLKKSKIFNPL